MTILQSCYIGYSKFSIRGEQVAKLLPNMKMHYLEEIKSNNLDLKKDRPIVLSLFEFVLFKDSLYSTFSSTK